MRRFSWLLIVVLLSLAHAQAEESSSTVNGITSTVVGDTTSVDQAHLNEVKTVQAQQLQMIMHLNKAEDLRNAEIHKRHEGYIKNIPALSEPVIAPATSEIAPAEAPKIATKKCGFWCRLFGGDQEQPVNPVPLPNDSGTVELDDF